MADGVERRSAIRHPSFRIGDSKSRIHLPGLDLTGRELVEFEVLKMAKEFALILKLTRGTQCLDPAIV